MRTLSEEQRRLCTLQARVFEVSGTASPCGSAVFVRRFMYSNFAKRLDDAPVSPVQAPLQQLVEDVDREFGKPYGTKRYSADELYWMGYLYRYWQCATGKTSKAIYHIMGARELRNLYLPYHTLDPMQAIERIMESKGLDDSLPSIEYAVVRMREIRARR